MVSPNTETNMKIDLRVNAASLRGLLDHVNINGQIDPVKIMFTPDGATVWAHDANKTLQIFVNDYTLDDYTLKSPQGCIVLETKKVSEMLSAKFGSTVVTLTANVGEPCEIKDNGGSSLTYYPPSEDECYVVPDHWVLPVGNNGVLEFPMIDNAEATLRVTLHPDELKKALTDMRVAGATYACIDFEENNCRSESGHWASKSNTSVTKITADVKIGQGSVTFPEVLAAVSDRLEGDSVEIQKHTQTPFFLLMSGSTTILVTEAQRAENV